MALCTSDGLFLWMPCRNTDKFYFLLESLCWPHLSRLLLTFSSRLIRILSLCRKVL